MTAESNILKQKDFPEDIQGKPADHRHGDLTQGNVIYHLIRLSVPMIWGILMVVGFQLADTYFISLLGDEKLAAFTFTFPVTYMIFSFIMGFGIATSSVVSRLIGSQSMDLVRRIVSHAIILVMIASILVGTAGLVSQEWLFTLLGASPDMVMIIKEYMTYWYLGAVFVSAPLVANAAMRATGDAIVPAIIMTIAMILNIILDPLLIFGLMGLPRMELAGAAIATVFANALAFAAGFYFLYARKKILCLKSLVTFTEFADSAKRIVMIALPVGITNIIQPVVNALIISLLAISSVEAVTAFGIATRIEAFAFVILMGVLVGLAPIVGQNFGAKEFTRVKETVNKAILFNILWSLFLACLFGLLAQNIGALFTDNTGVIDKTALYFWVVPISYACGNLLNGWASIFNALGQPKQSVIMIGVKYILIMIPALYIGHTLGAATGIFIALSVVNILTGLGFHYYCLRKLKSLTT